MEQTAHDGLIQPRRYQVRRLHDSDKLTQREIAERLGVSLTTVNRDLAETVAPAGYTEAGTPYYPPSRFDLDPHYRERVAALGREMPEQNARLQAAREFSGSADILRQPPPKPTVHQVGLMERTIKAASQGR